MNKSPNPFVAAYTGIIGWGKRPETLEIVITALRVSL